MQFNFIATYYDVLSQIIFGGVLDKAKVSLFDVIKNGDKVLLIGGGTGYSLKYLLELKSDLRVDFVDSSSKMILKASKKVNFNSSVNFFAKPIEKFEGSGYNAIISEFFFDLFEKNKGGELINTIAPKLTNGGIWIDTDFRKTLNKRHYFLLRAMYVFFRLIAQVTNSELHDHSIVFNSEELRLTKELRFKAGFISSCLYVRH